MERHKITGRDSKGKFRTVYISDEQLDELATESSIMKHRVKLFIVSLFVIAIQAILHEVL